MFTTRETCRACGSKNLEFLFSLGTQYVSDFVEKHEIKLGCPCPIVLELCKDCTLVQSKHTAPQDFLYTRHYWYRSGINPMMREALRDITRAIEERVDLDFGDVVLDIGSNDGTLLRSYSLPCYFEARSSYLIKVGVEPARNLAKEGCEGVDVFINEFWKKESYGLKEKPKVITAIGMFYDLEDPNQFISDIADTLHPEGVFVAQLMCLQNMININDVGNLAHEHLEFYSIKSLVTLFGKYGLEIFDIETNQVNGESYRIWVCHKDSWNKYSPKTLSHNLYKHLIEDNDFVDFSLFFAEMEENKTNLRKFIMREVAKGKKIWVYGASTKGNVLLQYYDLNSELITAAADKSLEKWGKYTVGTGIPIRSEEDFREADPDYALVLPYSFLDEFKYRESAWLDNGGQFVVPLPEFKVV